MICNYSYLDKVSCREIGEVSCGYFFGYNFQLYNINIFLKVKGDKKKENINKGLLFDLVLNLWR